MTLRSALRFFVPAIAATFGLAGCGGDEMKTAPVHGKVTFNGAPVPGGGLTFYPVGGEGEGQDLGKPASGSIQLDGTYTMMTYTEGDGVVIGKHRVAFTPPPPPGSEAAEVPEGAHAAAPPASPYAGAKPTTEEVEVKDGDNEINIELKK